MKKVTTPTVVSEKSLITNKSFHLYFIIIREYVFVWNCFADKNVKKKKLLLVHYFLEVKHKIDFEFWNIRLIMKLEEIVNIDQHVNNIS